VAGKPDPQEYQLKKKEIEKLNQRSASGEIDLYFGDESGFSLVPVVPYAWQPVGETIEIKSSLSKRINVLGFLSKNKDFKCITLEGSVNSDCIISAIDALFVDVKKETWLVLDNAPVHRSKYFKLKIDEWKRNNVYILFLPPYSPELNPIEILWRFIKYQWMPFSAYSSFDSLNSTLNHILANIGAKYNVTFA
tara:strand:- start:8 stop:586 length:579 start_codon:yes stop_codon:yes gene_type:complete